MAGHVQLLGEITEARTADLHARIRAAAAGRTPPIVVLDLTRATVFDDDAVATVVELGLELAAAGGQLHAVVGDGPARIALTGQPVHLWDTFADAPAPTDADTP